MKSRRNTEWQQTIIKQILEPAPKGVETTLLNIKLTEIIHNMVGEDEGNKISWIPRETGNGANLKFF